MFSSWPQKEGICLILITLLTIPAQGDTGKNKKRSQLKRQSSWLQIKNNSEHSISEKRAHDSWEGLGQELAIYQLSASKHWSLKTHAVLVMEGTFLRLHP